MTHDEAMQKVVKLLRLATSSNANEAALAASKAQEIIDRYQIEKAAIDLAANGRAEPDEPIRHYKDDPIEAGQRKSTWRLRLFSEIAKANACKSYFNFSVKGMVILGRPSDVATARYIYGHMVREVEFLSLRNCKGNGRTYANNFKIGVVDTIQVKLREQRASTQQTMRNEASNNQFALTLVNNAIARVEQKRETVNKWAKENLKLRPLGSVFRPDHSARVAGQIAGQSIRIGVAKAGVGRGVAGHIS